MQNIMTLVIGIILSILGFVLLFFLIRFIHSSAIYKKPGKITLFIKKILSQYGIFPKNEIYFSFKSSFDLLKNFLGTKDYLYELPFVLLCGAEKSGKMTLINSIKMDMPFGKQMDQDFESVIKWSFFDKGTIINVGSSVFLGESNYRWHILANILHNKRKKRPLDGLVLTIEASDIIKYNHNLCEAIQSRLWQLQRILGVKFPVYVVITKSDYIPGFASFCKNLSEKEKEQMFGWSSHHKITELYTDQWIDNYTKEFDSQLRFSISKVLAKLSKNDSKDAAEIIELPQSFKNVLTGLKKTMNTIFKNNKYIDALILRGIYFVGTSIPEIKNESHFIDQDTGIIGKDRGFVPERFRSMGAASMNDSVNPITGVAETNNILFQNDYKGSSREASQADFQGGYQDGPQGDLQASSQKDMQQEDMQNSKILQNMGLIKANFCTELFKKKIFAESGISIPTKVSLLSHTRHVKVQQILVITAIIAACFKLSNERYELKNRVLFLQNNLKKLEKYIDHIENNISRISKDEAMFDEMIVKILSTIDTLYRTKTRFHSMPFSFLSNPMNKLNSLVEFLYNKYIVDSIQKKILSKIEKTLQLNRFYTDYMKTRNSVKPVKSSSTLDALKITNSQEFLELQKFIIELNEIQKIISIVEDIKNGGKLENLQFLLETLFGAENIFYSSDSSHESYNSGSSSNSSVSHTHHNILHNTSHNHIKSSKISLNLHKITIDINRFQSRATKKFEILARNFLSFHFSPEQVIPMLRTLKNNLSQMEKMTEYSTKFHLLHDTLKEMTLFVNYIHSPDANWITKPDLTLNDEVEKLLAQAAYNKFIRTESVQFVKNTIHNRFAFFKRELMHYESQVTGPFFEINSMGELEISKKFMIVYGALNMLISESFMHLSSDSASDNLSSDNISSENPSSNLSSSSSTTDSTYLKSKMNKLALLNGEKVKEAIEDIQNYNKKLTSILANFPNQHKQSISILVKTGLNKSIMQKISNSIDTLENLNGKSMLSNMSSSETISMLSSSIFENMQQITYFIENGRRFLSNEFYNQFLQILLFQCQYILQEAEKIIINSGIYNPINIRGSFSDKANLKEKILLAYNATSQEELINHFANERDRLSKVIETYAKNAFTLMSKIYSVMPNMPNNSNEIFLKWKFLIESVENYMDTTRPNTLHDLERYILTDIMNAKSYSQLIQKFKTYSRKMFFRNVINTINKTIVSDFVNKQRVHFFEIYDEIKTFFDTNLKGKFPFISNQKLREGNFAEVSIETMTNFIKMLDKNRECFEIIEKDKDLDINPEIRLFLEQIANIYEIFQLNEDGMIYVNGIIDFNTRENTGINVENISGSKFTVLNSYEKDSSIRISDRKKSFKWTMKNGVELSFFISHESKYKFASSTYRSSSKVTDRNTTYIVEHNNHWSLFKLVYRNQYGNNGRIKIEMPIELKHNHKKHTKKQSKHTHANMKQKMQHMKNINYESNNEAGLKNFTDSETLVFIMNFKFSRKDGQIVFVKFPTIAPDYMPN